VGKRESVKQRNVRSFCPERGDYTTRMIFIFEKPLQQLQSSSVDASRLKTLLREVLIHQAMEEDKKLN
jgi:hypothetical protein